MVSEPAHGAPEPANAKRRKLWAALLVLDVVFIFVFGGAAAGLLYIRSTTPPLDQPAQRDKGRKGRAPAAAPAKAEEPKPEAKAEPKPEPKAEPIGAAAKTEKPAEPRGAVAEPAKQPAAAPAPSPGPGGKVRARSVEFTLPAAGAKEVLLKGAFLVRTAGKKAMVKDSQGTWRLSISLLPGSYKYSFVVDGKRAAGGTRVVE